MLTMGAWEESQAPHGKGKCACRVIRQPAFKCCAVILRAPTLLARDGVRLEKGLELDSGQRLEISRCRPLRQTNQAMPLLRREASVERRSRWIVRRRGSRSCLRCRGTLSWLCCVESRKAPSQLGLVGPLVLNTRLRTSGGESMGGTPVDRAVLRGVVLRNLLRLHRFSWFTS